MSGEFERVLSGAKRARGKGDLHQARLLFEKYLRVYPSNSRASLDLAEIYMTLELFVEASKVYARLLEIEPKQPVVLSNLGGALLRQGLLDEAKAVLDYALELDPKNIYARINLGGVLQGKELFKEALENALEAVSLDPTHPLAFNNLGSAFSDLAMNPEAKHAYETASMLDPNSIDALINLAGAESRLDRPEAAISAYERVLTMLASHERNRTDAVRFFAGFEHRTLGNLSEFWKGYECGFSPMIPKSGARSPNRQFKVPRWSGQRIPGKTLLIWREQGVGDEIMYASIINDLRSSGANVIFECEPRLETLWRRSFPWAQVRPANWDPISLHTPNEDFDFHIPLCSLGPIYRQTVESFSYIKPYIYPLQSYILDYQERLARLSNGRPRIGVLWRSMKFSPTRRLGYTDPTEWEGVFNRHDLCFINLQYNLHPSELSELNQKFGDVLHVFEEIDLKDDFERTTALISQLDLVISPDTTMFCLAGALGVPTILMWPGYRGYWGKRDNFIFFPSVDLLIPDRLGVSASELLKHLPERLCQKMGDISLSK